MGMSMTFHGNSVFDGNCWWELKGISWNSGVVFVGFVFRDHDAARSSGKDDNNGD